MGRTVVLDCLPWLAILLASFACLWLLGRCGRARCDWRRIGHLHQDQVGSAQSLSFVLVLPFFVMVILFIVQVSQLMIASIAVHYAAFAAARSAIVWLPARIPGADEENCISYYQIDSEADQVMPILDPTDPNYGPGTGGMTFRVIPGSAKYAKIASAAIMAVAPICPSRDLGYGLPGNWRTIADQMRQAFGDMAPRPASGGGVSRRLEHKLAYAIQNTTVEIRFFHSNAEPPLVQHYQEHDPEEFRPSREFGWDDPVTVTVHHKIALLPGPARLLASHLTRADGSPVIETNGGVYVYPFSASATLSIEGDKPVKRYDEFLD